MEFFRLVVTRIIQFILVNFLGISVTFLLPRLTPVDPINSLVANMVEFGDDRDPEAIEELIKTLKNLYGLEGTIYEQYLSFWVNLFKGDLGPSMTYFPTPVVEIIIDALPWTVGLMLTSITISFIVSNYIGTYSGYFEERKSSHILSSLAMVIYPIPHYILSLIILILFVFIWPVFPMLGGISVGQELTLSFEVIGDIIFHAFLPALALILHGIGGGFLVTRALSSGARSSDYVTYAEAGGLSSYVIYKQYVMKNIMLPRYTWLAMSIGNVFSGAVIIEYVFSYPGIGQVLYNATIEGDFNLMLGITIFSIVAVSFATLILDLIYPLLDPRIKFK